ncbi:hypothetical protein [Hymenobacter sp. APR13]|uniref:hypothetical protein n=1 Tax=Hymenobacter sp. APR13 TaxID=1356852 RepID=UPI0004E0972C|nr:hypothetical protein [Hymenobacter sp. APR13]AII53829.1 hypothetical protein N008_17830 [Hymenobacter sp. APR13]
MKKRFYLLGCLLLLGSAPVLAQTTGAEVVVIRTYEAAAGSARIVVSRGKQQSTILDVATGVNDKNLVSAAETYQQLITSLYQEGYVLQGTLNTAAYLNTLIFIKAPKP